MKKYWFVLLVSAVCIFAGCSKKDDDASASKTPSDYAAAMAGIYNNVSVTTTLWEGENEVDGETLSGTLTLSHPSGDVVEASFVRDGQRFAVTGYCDGNGVLHVRPFSFFTIDISELSSSIKMTGDNTLSGSAECALRQGENVRRAVLEVMATRN